MRQQGNPALAMMGRRGNPLPCSVHACYRTIRGRPPFESSRICEHQIERAISNLKRSAWDKWFRRQWYRAAWQRERRAERRQWAEAQDLSRSCPASR